MSRILVTGATGFVGRALVARLRRGRADVTALSRRDRLKRPKVVQVHCDLAREDPPRAALRDVDAVIHLAGHAHTEEPADEAGRQRIRAVNRDGTLRMARAAAEANVSRFVFVSSAVVHGPGPFPAPIREDAPLAPATTYAASKAEAETALWDLAAETGLDVTVLRPPLVYGPGAGGNFARLVAWAQKGRPLPSAAKANQRSMVGLDNLCDALVTASRHPQAGGRAFFVADDEDLSTGELYARICRALGRQPRFLPLPGVVLSVLLRAAGRRADASRLLGDVRLDTTAIHEQLGWQPRWSVDDEIASAVGGGGRGQS